MKKKLTISGIFNDYFTNYEDKVSSVSMIVDDELDCTCSPTKTCYIHRSNATLTDIVEENKLINKPCPFCQNPNAPENDSGDACCFCDYEGVVSVGKNGVFSNLDQYNKVYLAKGHKNRLDELHGRNDNPITELT